MPEPFKNLFNLPLIDGIGEHLLRHDPAFDRVGFVAAAGEGLEALELKQRSAQITRALERYLPDDFEIACDLMLAALDPDQSDDFSAEVSGNAGLRGWAVMPMTDYVAARGLAQFDRSMAVLAEMTKRFTSEGAVRPFIAAEPERAMAYLLAWSEDDNVHVRRLASEGSRPRLPWHMQLTGYIANPAPLIPLLTRLRDDPEEYVRRSVANNLNDIAKDHPDLVAEVARDWLQGASKDRIRLIKHGCRTLIKQGHAATLDALGFGPARVTMEGLRVLTPAVEFGGALEFVADLRSDADADQNIVLDYIVHHRKANGSTSPKVFKWKVLKLPARARVTLKRRHPMRAITTRVYYNGAHCVEVVANGVSLGAADFDLIGV